MRFGCNPHSQAATLCENDLLLGIVFDQTDMTASEREDGVPEVIGHREWLEKDFLTIVQKRGAAIIEARGLSSAASAANAVVDTVRGLTTPTPPEDWFSVAVCSDGSYGIEKGLLFSYPIQSEGKSWKIVQGVPVNEFSRAKITATENELKEEKSMVSGLLPK